MIFPTIVVLPLASSSLAAVIQIAGSLESFSLALLRTLFALSYVSSLARASQSSTSSSSSSSSAPPFPLPLPTPGAPTGPAAPPTAIVDLSGKSGAALAGPISDLVVNPVAPRPRPAT
ncbi:hypothetical protein ACHQM5_017418 [Ranunculus cassubicifolius]